jgi:phospholipid/cholesterol/gamma-HCH transport system ATP-binding protein
MDALIELKGVTVRFGAQLVADHVNLALKRDETLALVGGSGSGKSTLLRTMLGLSRPVSGQVLIEGENLYALSPEQRLELQRKWGVLFQSGALFSGLSVLDNVALPLREHTTLADQEIETLAFLKLRMVGLDAEAADKLPSALSGGMITRAGLARAMALDPEMLFLDEPTGALDPVSAGSIDELMRSLRKSLRLSILVITHDPNTIATVCDRIAMIVDKKVEAGTLEEMLDSDNPKIREFFHSARVQAALHGGA